MFLLVIFSWFRITFWHFKRFWKVELHPGRIQTRRVGILKLGGAKMVFTCLNTKGCLQQSLGVTQKWLLL